MFAPYKAYRFAINASRMSSVSTIYSGAALVYFSEFSLPLLDINVPSQLLSSTINPNDEIFLTLIYNSNADPDKLFYSGTLIYDSEEVAVIIFKYTSVRFKIWSFFNDF